MILVFSDCAQNQFSTASLNQTFKSFKTVKNQRKIFDLFCKFSCSVDILMLKQSSDHY